jgi:hypothetical protein
MGLSDLKVTPFGLPKIKKKKVRGSELAKSEP